MSSTPHTQREAHGGSGKKWKLEHLPKGTSEVFTNQLVPLTKSLTGSLSPWEGLSKEQVQELVDKIYGPNGFGSKAAEALKRYIEVDQAEFFNDRQVITDWVQFSLTPDGNPPMYPFLWKEWNINEETGKVTKKVCISYDI